MSIAVGDRLPGAIFLKLEDGAPKEVPFAPFVDGKKIVVFGLPGAFTSTCSTAHLPSFMRTVDGFKAKGVDHVICVAVNDPHVMKAWGESTGGAEAGVVFMADADAAFTKAMGMNFTVPVAGFYDRSRRYALVAEDGVVTLMHEEPGRECGISTGEQLLEAMG